MNLAELRHQLVWVQPNPEQPAFLTAEPNPRGLEPRTFHAPGVSAPGYLGTCDLLLLAETLEQSGWVLERFHISPAGDQDPDDLRSQSYAAILRQDRQTGGWDGVSETLSGELSSVTLMASAFTRGEDRCTLSRDGSLWAEAPAEVLAAFNTVVPQLANRRSPLVARPTPQTSRIRSLLRRTHTAA